MELGVTLHSSVVSFASATWVNPISSGLFIVKQNRVGMLLIVEKRAWFKQKWGGASREPATLSPLRGIFLQGSSLLSEPDGFI